MTNCRALKSFGGQGPSYMELGVSNSLIEIGSNRLIGPKMAIDLKPVP